MYNAVNRDGNAATNIRAEGVRILQTDGTAVSEERRGSKTKVGTQVRSEAFPRDVRSLHYSRFDKRVGSSRGFIAL